MDILHLLADETIQVGSALLGALTPKILALIFGGSLLGLIVGAIPGLTATMALALLINLSYGMELDSAVAFLLAVYVGAVSGGLNAAIMITVMPAVLVYLIFQRYFVSGLAAGAVKG